MNRYEKLTKHNQKALAKVQLQKAYDEGYRYITKDQDSEFVHCFSLKPKKYRGGDFPDYWGYKESDLNSGSAFPAKIIKGKVEGVKWSKRYPTEISELLNTLKEGK
ncbi:hypothetical protein [Carnobacterium maltaromaticum]|uniref:hypothetical protein n=1 Tax=Carnobacterium maltaromaticum TaxID=2751 RepID=UPI0039B03558